MTHAVIDDMEEELSRERCLTRQARSTASLITFRTFIIVHSIASQDGSDVTDEECDELYIRLPMNDPAGDEADPNSVYVLPREQLRRSTREIRPRCPRFHSHRGVLRSQVLTLNVVTCDMPTLLSAAGVHPSRQHAVIRLTCAFLKKTGQLQRLC
ncbi:hypothetical protein GWK47_038054 [Chionoecetes opilio]|uniref:Uncharacterized protein n=1 Tax=Chionoecetes opilio TaxID=41210 RepID=A0A8J4YNP7_CHIOP|nr:hypothetical protein GWK47_038054 [Chionoecetes opilio]